MNDNWKKDYPSTPDITEEGLDENHSLKKMLRLVGENKRVIDFGCATGYFAQLLTRRGCRVTGVEINSDAAKVAELHCEQVIVADLDFVSLTEVLPVHEFDVAIFGDVLEHLRNPWQILESAQQLLKPEGCIVASIPNVAHGAIRLALLEGKFEYTELGILDSTHLRFFTRKTVEELFERSGYFIDVIECTKLPVFASSSLIPSVDKSEIGAELSQKIENSEGADDFQFIIRAFPSSQQGKNAALNQRSKLIYQLEHSQLHLRQTQGELNRSQSQIQDTQSELERSLQQASLTLSQLHQTQAELKQLQAQAQDTLLESQRSQIELQQTREQLGQSETELQQTREQLGQSQIRLQQTQKQLGQSETELQQTQEQLVNSQTELQQTQEQLVNSQGIISGMESSKFWKLRTAWFCLKQATGLSTSSTPTSSASSSSPQIMDLLDDTTIPRIENFEEINFKANFDHSPSGHFDGINGSTTQLTVPQGIPLTALGWAILDDRGRPADSVIITCGDNNSLVAVAPVNLERQDVIKVSKNLAYKNSGWSATFNSSSLPLGKVVLKAWAFNSALKDAIQLNCTPTIEVLPAGAYYNEDPYCKWLSKNLPREADLRKMAETAEILGYKPVISVIMPVFNPPEQFLREAIESVLNQVYPHWELCIADDTSTKSYVRTVLEEYRAKDSRIKVVFRTENGHIAAASNSALEISTGEFIALLDHDDLLTPDALYEVALLLNRHPNSDMIYSDEDKLDEHNRLKEPIFKPDWCPDTFLSKMYTCHLGIYRHSLVREVGGFRIGYEGSQDYDLVLRLTEKTENIFHIPKVLYHWRIHPQSAASGSLAKPYAYKAAEQALADALSRRGENGIVFGIPGYLGLYSVRYKIENYKLVSIIIPTKDLGETLDKCLTSIFAKSIYPNYEVIVIDNGSIEEYTTKIINDWKIKEPTRFRAYELDIPFNFSKINNYAVNQAKGEYLLFLNNDIEVVNQDWIDAMVEQAQRPSIGAVGCLLLYPDNTVQHAGIVLGIGGVGSHSHKQFPSTSPGYCGQAITINNYSAITGACLMCRREAYDSVAGFEENLAVAYNDIDFCLKLVEKGYRNIYLPHVVLYHHESKSRGKENTSEKLARLEKEAKYMQNKWRNVLENDPCYNPNLTRKGDDYSINV